MCMKGRHRAGAEVSILGSLKLPTKIQLPSESCNCNSYLEIPFLVYKPHFWPIQCFLLQEALPERSLGVMQVLNQSFVSPAKHAVTFKCILWGLQIAPGWNALLLCYPPMASVHEEKMFRMLNACKKAFQRITDKDFFILKIHIY